SPIGEGIGRLIAIAPPAGTCAYAATGSSAGGGVEPLPASGAAAADSPMLADSVAGTGAAEASPTSSAPRWAPAASSSAAPAGSAAAAGALVAAGAAAPPPPSPPGTFARAAAGSLYQSWLISMYGFWSAGTSASG